MSARDTVVRPLDEAPFVVVGLREARLAVTAGDPCAGAPGTVTVPDEAALLALVRGVLVRDHLAPLIGELRARTRTGERGLWGSVAESLAAPLYGHGSALPGAAGAVRDLLDGLGPPVAGLVEPSGEPPGVRRRTCCLWASLPDRSPCPSCCLIRRS